MTVLADGINLDGNTRLLLAAYDARTLDDFYLMADIDFKDLINKAKETNNCLPPLQVRKIRILRRWLKEIIDENMGENDDSPRTRSSSSSSSINNKHNRCRLVPKDWIQQYQNDLPHLKMQLRQQGDSLLERYPIINIMLGIVGCGTGI